MKKTILFVTLCCLFVLSACSKSGLDAFRGDYSFKTSGLVTIQRQATLFDTVPPAAITFELPHEIGQLNIATLDGHEDKAVVIINYLNDDVIVTEGFCDGNVIELNEYQRSPMDFSIDAQTNIQAPMTVRAVGHLYDQDNLLFSMTYHGKVKVGSLTYHIDGEDVKMVAYRN